MNRMFAGDNAEVGDSDIVVTVDIIVEASNVPDANVAVDGVTQSIREQDDAFEISSRGKLFEKFRVSFCLIHLLSCPFNVAENFVLSHVPNCISNSRSNCHAFHQTNVINAFSVAINFWMDFNSHRDHNAYTST